MTTPSLPALTFLPVPTTGRGARAMAAVALVVVAAAALALGGLLLGSERVVQVTAAEVTAMAGPRWLRHEHRLALADVQSVRPVTVRGGHRVLGTSMPGHCTGTWSYADLGEVFQVSDCGDRALLVQARGARWLLQAPDLDGLQRALQEHKPFAFASHDGMGAPLTGLVVVLLAITLLTGAAVVWLTWKAPGLLRYRVEGGQLVVSTGWGDTAVALAGATVSDQDAPLTLRLMGVGMPGLHVGWYLQGRRRARVWATRMRGGLVIDGAMRCIVTPEDREGMRAALLAAGAKPALSAP
ncbi:MAG: hypothetical protein HY902_06205 [Deltaproteobacteria bacterium]|nr:hypothetical protein [Deltaproteobacteria bacterium]